MKRVNRSQTNKLFTHNRIFELCSRSLSKWTLVQHLHIKVITAFSKMNSFAPPEDFYLKQVETKTSPYQLVEENATQYSRYFTNNFIPFLLCASTPLTPPPPKRRVIFNLQILTVGFYLSSLRFVIICTIYYIK